MSAGAEAFFIGDACLCWRFGADIDRDLSLRILSLYRLLRDSPRRAELAVRDIVPAYTTLAVHAHPLADWAAIRGWMEENLAGSASGPVEKPPPQLHELPVTYDGEDLAEVARQAGLAPEEVARRHCRPRYLVAMIGFRPHFPYLLGLDECLATPRRAVPRLKVPAGSVAIGGKQTGVYPEESPGGWNLIGRTDPARLTAIAPGDEVRFIPDHAH